MTDPQIEDQTQAEDEDPGLAEVMRKLEDVIENNLPFACILLTETDMISLNGDLSTARYVSGLEALKIRKILDTTVEIKPGEQQK